MISKMLVPTDGSETANKSVRYAAGLSKQMDAKIILLSVIDINVPAIFAQTVSAADSPTHLIEPVEDYLKQTAEIYPTETERVCKENCVQSNKVIRSGHPVEVIIMGKPPAQPGDSQN